MSIRKILTYPDPILRKKTEMVTVFDDQLKLLVEEMAETMYDAPGIGLAAPQIGESIKLIVVDISSKHEEKEEHDEQEKREWMVLVNPEIVEHKASQIDEEGCLSVPELTSKVTRYKQITVNYHDIEGKEQSITTQGRFAVVLQHEIDHLNGILFIDHLSSLKRNLYKKKVRKWMKP